MKLTVQSAPVEMAKVEPPVAVRPAPVKPAPANKAEPVAPAPTPAPVPAPTPLPTPVVASPPPAAPPPPPPPVIDCHAPTYTGLHYGTLRWQNGVLDPDAVLVIGGPDQNLMGGRLGGQRLPGCDVTVTPATAGISIEDLPSRADGFRRVKVRNTAKAAISLVEIQWREK